jgi:hypothetical protein
VSLAVQRSREGESLGSRFGLVWCATGPCTVQAFSLLQSKEQIEQENSTTSAALLLAGAAGPDPQGLRFCVISVVLPVPLLEAKRVWLVWFWEW